MGSSPQDLEVDYRQATRPRLLVGIGLGLVSSLGWLGQWTPVTGAVSLFLAAGAAYLVITGRARRGRVRYEPSLRSIDSTLHRRKVVGVEYIELVAKRGELEGRPRPSYAADAVTEDGSRYEIFESNEPSKLVRWGRTLDRALPVRVTWASDHPRVGEWLSQAPAQSTARQTDTTKPHRIQGTSHAGQQKMSRLLLIIAASLGVIWSIFLASSQASPAPLSVALAAFSVLFILLTAALVSTDQTTIELGDVFRVERRRLGVRIFQLELPRRTIRRAESLTPDGEEGFLLIATEQEIFSVPLAQPATDQVARALGLNA